MEKVVVPGLGVAGFMTVTCPLFPGLVYTELHLGCNVLQGLSDSRSQQQKAEAGQQQLQQQHLLSVVGSAAYYYNVPQELQILHMTISPGSFVQQLGGMGRWRYFLLPLDIIIVGCCVFNGVTSIKQQQLLEHGLPTESRLHLRLAPSYAGLQPLLPPFTG